MHYLVLEVIMSENALNSDLAFKHILSSMPDTQAELLQYHTKISARKLSVSKITGRDSKKEVTVQDRIPLPFKCEHTFATKENNPFFHGVRFVKYPNNGEVWAHVELVQHVKDGYTGRDVSHARYMNSIHEETAAPFEEVEQDNTTFAFAE